ncbi:MULTISPECIES: hypothetical protein [unclassified Wolbachia]
MAKDCTNVAITKAFLLGGCHPSVTHWDDKKGATRMTGEGGTGMTS